MPHNKSSKENRYDELLDSFEDNDTSLNASRVSKPKEKKKKEVSEKDKKMYRKYSVLYIISAVIFFVIGILLICLINYLRGEGFGF